MEEKFTEEIDIIKNENAQQKLRIDYLERIVQRLINKNEKEPFVFVKGSCEFCEKNNNKIFCCVCYRNACSYIYIFFSQTINYFILFYS
jgi:hypothetical protein